MKRIDEGKVSLVEFLRSLKYNKRSKQSRQTECPTHFATLHSQAQQDKSGATEDFNLIRSAN